MNEQVNAAAAQGNASETLPMPKLWNPSVATWLSVIMSPLFGMLIHALNWRAIGRSDLAKTNVIWAIASFVALPILGLVFKHQFLCMIAVVAAWHFLHGSAQEKFIKEHYGTNYEKKSWWIPVGIFLGILIALIVVITGICTILGKLSSLAS